jgi:cell division protein FtsB
LAGEGKMDEKVKENPLAIKSGDIFPGPELKVSSAYIQRIVKENNRLSEEWQKCHDWNNKIVDENQNLKARIKETEQERERLSKLLILERMKVVELEGELSKWKAPHEDSELQEMKEQSQQSSLSAKQAYINALEWRVKHLERNVKELEEGLEKIGRDKYCEVCFGSLELDGSCLTCRLAKKAMELTGGIEEYLTMGDTGILYKLVEKK